MRWLLQSSGCSCSFFAVVLSKGAGFWQPEFLFGRPSNTQAGGGIGPQLINSFYMLVVTLLLSVPLSLGAGIYLAEYAKQGRIVGFIRLCLETMASLPSIVVGLFGLLAFVTLTGWGYTLLGGALAVTIINLPGLTRICETAILDVPANIKRGVVLPLERRAGRRWSKRCFRPPSRKLSPASFYRLGAFSAKRLFSFIPLG